MKMTRRKPWRLRWVAPIALAGVVLLLLLTAVRWPANVPER